VIRVLAVNAFDVVFKSYSEERDFFTSPADFDTFTHL